MNQDELTPAQVEDDRAQAEMTEAEDIRAGHIDNIRLVAEYIARGYGLEDDFANRLYEAAHYLEAIA
jgi:hypothetical protein